MTSAMRQLSFGVASHQISTLALNTVDAEESSPVQPDGGR